jgi:hypothetical protein
LVVVHGQQWKERLADWVAHGVLREVPVPLVVHALYGRDVSTVTTDAFAPLSMPHSTRLYTVLDEDKRVGVLMEIYHSCSVGAPSLPPPPTLAQPCNAVAHPNPYEPIALLVTTPIESHLIPNQLLAKSTQALCAPRSVARPLPPPSRCRSTG